MRMLVKVALLIGSVLVAAPAFAQRVTIADDRSAHYSPYSVQIIEPPWIPQRQSPLLVERPLADVVSTKLGIAKGRVELFRYRLENAPSNATVVDGVVNGAGIRLRLSW